MAKDDKNKTSAESSIEEQLSGCVSTSPSQWHQGKPFVFLAENAALSLIPESPLEAEDTLSMRGTIWYYDSMVAEEDWMGQQLLQLRFKSPTGRYYRYSTGRPMSSFSDSTYMPALSVMYPVELIQQTDSILRSHLLYILYNDERVFYPTDSIRETPIKHQKFVPVRIDSVTYGIETAPLKVCFTYQDVEPGYFYTSLPGSRQSSTSVPITRFLSVSDPYLPHPDITPETWAKIQYSQIEIDMTSEEIRLAWGRPSRIEKGASRNGLVEFWYYSNNRILQIWDGRLSKIGFL